MVSFPISKNLGFGLAPSFVGHVGWPYQGARGDLAWGTGGVGLEGGGAQRFRLTLERHRYARYRGFFFHLEVYVARDHIPRGEPWPIVRGLDDDIALHGGCQPAEMRDGHRFET